MGKHNMCLLRYNISPPEVYSSAMKRRRLEDISGRSTDSYETNVEANTSHEGEAIVLPESEVQLLVDERLQDFNMLYKIEQPENDNETEIINDFSPESSYVDNCNQENAAKFLTRSTELEKSVLASSCDIDEEINSTVGESTRLLVEKHLQCVQQQHETSFVDDDTQCHQYSSANCSATTVEEKTEIIIGDNTWRLVDQHLKVCAKVSAKDISQNLNTTDCHEGLLSQGTFDHSDACISNYHEELLYQDSFDQPENSSTDSVGQSSKREFDQAFDENRIMKMISADDIVTGRMELVVKNNLEEAEREQMHLGMSQQGLGGDITVAEETLDSPNMYLKYREQLLQELAAGK